MLQVEELNQYYGGSHILRDLSFEAHRRGDPAGAQRRGQDHAAEMPDGGWSRRATAASAGRAKPSPVKTASAGAGGHRLCAAGAGDFPAPDGGGKSADGAGAFPAPLRTAPDPIYDLFPVLRQMKDRRGGDLSGGQQQQLAIGRALACRPQLLILDEPTEGIQPSIKEIGAVIKQLAAKGDMAILLVEQFYDFAADLADSYLVMSRGSIVRGAGSNMEQDGVRGLVAI